MFENCQRAVSKVLGVVLMVAIVVLLASVVWTMVGGFGEELNEPVPQVAFDMEYHDDVEDPENFHPALPGNTNEVLVLTHDAGNQFDPSQVDLVIRQDGEVEFRASWAESSTGQNEVVGSADALYPHAFGSATLSDKTIQLVWTEGDEGTSQILLEWEGEDVE